MKLFGSALTLSVLVFTGVLPALAAAPIVLRDNVVVIELSDVALPERLPGDCSVEAQVREVWSGTAFHLGQRISLSVPCGHQAPIVDPRPARPRAPGEQRLDVSVLHRSALAAVHVDDRGGLIWAPSRPHDEQSVVGYQPLSATKLQLRRS
jgi:hypothetical protein